MSEQKPKAAHILACTTERTGLLFIGMGQLAVGARASRRAVLDAVEFEVHSDTMWRSRRDPGSPQPTGGSSADTGQKLPDKGHSSGAVSWEGFSNLPY